MKKIVAAVVVLMLFVSVLSGCGKKETIPLEYSTEVLINKEVPSEKYVFAGGIAMPSKGTGIMSFSRAKLFATFDREEIKTVEISDSDQYLETYDTDGSVKMHELLKMKRSEQSRKFNMALYRENGDYSLFEDAVLFHFSVPEGNVYKEEPTEYAGKFVFIEYRRAEDESYIQAIGVDEFNPSDRDRLISSYIGRVGDIYYFENGYYDFSVHSYKRYESEDELPVADNEIYTENKKDKIELAQLIAENEVLSSHFPERGYYHLDEIYVVGDRMYVYMGDDNRYISSGYSSDMFFIMLDAYTREVLYAQKYTSTNYNLYGASGAYSVRMYEKGDGGLLYDVQCLKNDK